MIFKVLFGSQAKETTGAEMIIIAFHHASPKAARPSCEIISNITHRIPRECIKTCMSKIFGTINPSSARSREQGIAVIAAIVVGFQANSLIFTTDFAMQTQTAKHC